MPENNPTTELAVPKAVAARACYATHLGAWLMDHASMAGYVKTVSQLGVERIVAMADKSPPSKFSPQVHAIAELLGVKAAMLPVGDDGEEEGGTPPYVNFGGTAIIPVNGPLTKQPSSMQSAFGGSSTIGMRKALSLALADQSVQRIMFHIDSPGGTVAGTGDLGDDIFAAGSIKPTASFIEDSGASAAYWIASQTKKVYASPNSQLIGSIGTMWVLYDTSEAYEKDGIKVHAVMSTPGKGLVVDGLPLTKERIAKVQSLVDSINGMFLASVARGRGVPISAAKKMSGDADIYNSEQARAAGLVDNISSFREALADFAKADNTAMIRPAMKGSRHSAKPEIQKAGSIAARTAKMPDEDSDMTAQLATLRAEVAEQKKVADTDRAARIAAEAKLVGNEQLLATIKTDLAAASEATKRLESERAAIEAAAAVAKLVSDGKIATETTDYFASLYVKLGKTEFEALAAKLSVSTPPVRPAKAVASLAGSQPTQADREAIEKAMSKVF